MKSSRPILSRPILCTIIAGLLISVSGVSFAQETASPAKAESKQETKEAPKKVVKKRPTFMSAVEDSVSNLTQEQSAALKKLLETASAGHKTINEAVGLTWKLNKKREEILDGLSTDKSYAERSAEASKQAGFTQAQIGSIKKVSEVYRQFRYDGMKVLTAEQQSKMPQWFKDDFSHSVALAEKEAAAKTE